MNTSLMTNPLMIGYLVSAFIAFVAMAVYMIQDERSSDGYSLEPPAFTMMCILLMSAIGGLLWPGVVLGFGFQKFSEWALNDKG